MGKLKQVPNPKVLPPGKSVRKEFDPTLKNLNRPVWSVAFFDHEGPWGKGRCEQEILWNTVFPKMCDFEKMSWDEITKRPDLQHSVEVYKLIPEARKRLEDLKIDDVDKLFRFRLSNKERIWGVRQGEVFRILWLDPEHEICPSPKKHT